MVVPDVPWEPILRKGVDEFLAENGIKYFFVEGSLLHGGESLGVYADKFGPLKELYKQFQKETVQVEYRPYTTYRPYLVAKPTFNACQTLSLYFTISAVSISVRIRGASIFS